MFKFQKGETVFCYHGPTYYPAQVKKLDIRILIYFIFIYLHFQMMA